MSKFLPTVSDLFSQVHEVEENWQVNPILKFRVADRPREILKGSQANFLLPSEPEKKEVTNCK